MKIQSPVTCSGSPAARHLQAGGRLKFPTCFDHSSLHALKEKRRRATCSNEIGPTNWGLRSRTFEIGSSIRFTAYATW